MKPASIIAFVLVLLTVAAHAQTLGEFKPKDQSYGLGKLKKVDKKIYIAGFEVNYQIYNEKQNFKQGGYVMGGGQRGDAQVEVSIGLEGLDEKTVIAITDKLYADYINKLKADGFTIITADEAGKTDTYSDFMRMQGGKVSLAEIPGVMNTNPTGFEYYIRKLDKDGKAKKGGFLGNEAAIFPKLGKELGDAIIGNVDISVLFVEDKNSFQGNGAKLKIKTNLRISATEGVIMTEDAAIKMKGQNSVTMATSTVAFYHGKVGAGATTTYSGTLGDYLEINDVVDETTVKSYAAGSTDFGTKSMYYTYYNVRNGNSANAKVIAVDPAKYSEGVYAGASKFLNFHLDEFLKSFK